MPSIKIRRYDSEELTNAIDIIQELFPIVRIKYKIKEITIKGYNEDKIMYVVYRFCTDKAIYYWGHGNLSFEVNLRSINAILSHARKKNIILSVDKVRFIVTIGKESPFFIENVSGAPKFKDFGKYHRYICDINITTKKMKKILSKFDSKFVEIRITSSDVTFESKEDNLVYTFCPDRILSPVTNNDFKRDLTVKVCLNHLKYVFNNIGPDPILSFSPSGPLMVKMNNLKYYISNVEDWVFYLDKIN